jgi:succinoglycan biosynthesis protein ExoM
MKIIIAICTYKRSASLQRCLDSLHAMIIPDAVALEIMVIDNEPSQMTLDICTQKNVTYYAEPQRGLVFARNAVLQQARRKNPDYLGIIDDDETVSQNWLVEMLHAFESSNADAVAGIITIKLDETMPSYLKKAYQFKKITNMTTVKTMPMGNIMLGQRIINSDIWFDKKFNFTGGEDIDFFSRVYKNGHVLYKIPNAEVTEYLMPEKASLGAYFNRQMRVAKLHYSEKYPQFSVKFAGECLLSVSEIVLVILSVPFCLLSDSIKVKAVKISAKAIGRLLSISASTAF